MKDEIYFTDYTVPPHNDGLLPAEPQRMSEMDFLDSLMQRQWKSDMHFIPGGFCLLFIRDCYGRVVKSGSGRTAREAVQAAMEGD